MQSDCLLSIYPQERQLTYKCLDDNGYDKSKCAAFIENGKYCNQFWVRIFQFSLRFFAAKLTIQLFSICVTQLAIRLERRENGIHPEIPVGEEREKVRQEFMKRYKKPTVHVPK